MYGGGTNWGRQELYHVRGGIRTGTGRGGEGWVLKQTNTE